MAMAEKEVPNYVTVDYMRSEVRYMQNQVDKLKKQLKLVMAILVDKKMLSENLLKAFQETKPNDMEKLAKWLEKQVNQIA